MDGNRRWAKNRFMPAALGHAAGARRVREIVKACAEAGVPYLSLFAFSTENWKRPEEEVSSLMGLFMTYLEREVASMNDNGVRLRVLGDVGRFAQPLQALIRQAEAQTASNTRITLLVCANYGGRWDVVQAVQNWQAAHPNQSIEDLTEEVLAQHLSTAGMPELDLLIRTGGESRLSNFLIWQAAYAELYFTDCTIPADRIVGEPGTGFQTAMRTLDHTRVTIAAQAVGVAQGALDHALGYAQERTLEQRATRKLLFGHLDTSPREGTIGQHTNSTQPAAGLCIRPRSALNVSAYTGCQIQTLLRITRNCARATGADSRKSDHHR